MTQQIEPSLDDTTNPSRPKHAHYTKEQISKHLNHISFHDSSRTLLHQDTLISLTSLQTYQLATVPFENISLHYSPSHEISLDPEHLYRKIVTHGHGGYCMENNLFFGTVLRTLGYKLHSVGARVNESVSGSGSTDYMGWGHMVNIVTLDDGKKYMVDVGYGGSGPIRPMLLDSENSLGPGIAPGESRLILENIPQNSDPSQKMWIYQHRNNSQSAWMPQYCFTELEFLPRDYEVMNFWTSQSPKSWFTQRVVALKMIVEAGEIVGYVSLLDKEIKRKVGGKTELLRTCKGEAERVDALERWFGVKLTEEERDGIVGTATELKE